MDHRQEKRKFRKRSAGDLEYPHEYNSRNILFLAYILRFLILFLALMLSDSSVTHYTSIRYKAEFRNALHILLHNSKPRNNTILLDSISPLPYPAFHLA